MMRPRSQGIFCGACRSAASTVRCTVREAVEAGPMDQLLGYCIAVGQQQGRKIIHLQTLPACDEPFDVEVGKSDFRCLPWRWRERVFARSSINCAATSVMPHHRKDDCCSSRMTTFAISSRRLGMLRPPCHFRVYGFRRQVGCWCRNPE